METKKLPPFILLEGEGQTIEFKEKLTNLDREIVAFANANGGTIYLGIRDNNEVCGVEINNKLKSQIMDIARNCDPSIEVALTVYPDEEVVAIIVSEGTDKPYRCKDGFFLRTGPSSQKLRRDEIVELVNDSDKVHFDEALNQKFQHPEDFSEEKLKGFLKQCGIHTNIPMEEILLNLNVASQQGEALQLSNAAILCFAKQPQRFHREAFVTAVKYQSNDRFSIIDKKDFAGSLIEQIEDTMAFILRHMNVGVDTNFSGKNFSAAGSPIYDYPPAALREAVVNAITHRDYYYDSSHIYVHMYPNHIDIENPGGLFPGIKVENLGTRSVRRNRAIADLLHRAGYIERIGSGFDRMHCSLEENNNPPLVVTATNFFNIRFMRRLPEQLEATLTPRQLSLYQLFQEQSTLTIQQITDVLNTSSDTARRELKELINLGLIVKKGTGKATTYHRKH